MNIVVLEDQFVFNVIGSVVSEIGGGDRSGEQCMIYNRFLNMYLRNESRLQQLG